MAQNNGMKRINMTVVGRGGVEDKEGKIALNLYRADQPWLEAVNEEKTFDPSDISLRNVIIGAIVDKTHELIDAGYVGSINVYTLREGIVLKYYELAKKISANRNHGVPFEVESCYRDFHTDADKEAILALATVIQDALEAGCLFRMNDVSLANYLELVVPEGVQLKHGDKLDFTEGKAPNGVTVRNWKAFARKNAEVIVMNPDSEYPVYALRRSIGQNMPKAQAKLANVISKLWAKCPRPELKTTEQKGTASGLAA